MGTTLQIIGGLLMLVMAMTLVAVGLYLGYLSYGAFKAGEILQAVYLVIAASIFLRK